VCTVSVVPDVDGVRIVCNRDEQRSRPPALPPRWFQLGDRRAVYPVDPLSGGTWIAANDAGLVLVLLNRSATIDRGRLAPPRSRGAIVPALIGHDRLVAAFAAGSEFRPYHFDPFQLVGLQGTSLAVLTNDCHRLTKTFVRLEQPLMWTSSSLGDALVERPRQALFDHLVAEASRGGRRPAQRRFHRHRWDRHPELSVLMNRSDARTVSRTVIDLSTGRVRLHYEPLEERFVETELQLEGAA
jgi:hypothetical protein